MEVETPVLQDQSLSLPCFPRTKASGQSPPAQMRGAKPRGRAKPRPWQRRTRKRRHRKRVYMVLQSMSGGLYESRVYMINGVTLVMTDDIAVDLQ